MKPIQCRMARAALEWTTAELGARAGVGANTVNRFEGGQDARVSSVEKMRVALETAGVIFVEENGDGPGVRLKKQTSGHTMRIERENFAHYEGKRVLLGNVSGVLKREGLQPTTTLGETGWVVVADDGRKYSVADHVEKDTKGFIERAPQN